MLTKKMCLEDKLFQHVPIHNQAQIPNVFGVEVELEGRNICQPPPEISVYWSQHQDGSLRKLKFGDEAIEYVFKYPLDILDTEKAIINLFNFLNRPGCIVYPSYRTSIHVHVNYAMESFRTIYNSITISTILDELLVSQNGEHRIGNNFCLRQKDAMGQIVSIISSIEKEKHFFGIRSQDRYSSVNFGSLFKFGSIEYRSLECTTHQGRVMHWVGTLQTIKEISRTFKNPAEIIQQFSQFDADEFLQKLLGPYSIKYLNVDGYENMLLNGVRIAQDLAYCSAWNEKIFP